MNVRSLLTPLALALPLAGSLALPQQTQVATRMRSGWSTGLQVDRPFYLVGDTLRVRGDLSNFSRQTAHGFVPIAGGNGCTFWTTIHDFNGNVVWQPGSVLNGTYQGPGCLFGSTAFHLTSGSERVFAVDVPLVYQNPGGFGTQGDFLPAGVYTVDMEIRFGGPNRSAFDPPGQLVRTSLPIHIE